MLDLQGCPSKNAQDCHHIPNVVMGARVYLESVNRCLNDTTNGFRGRSPLLCRLLPMDFVVVECSVS